MDYSSTQPSGVSKFPKYLDSLDTLNIYNLPKFKIGNATFDAARYNDFMTFYNAVINKVDSEIKSGKGNIINVHPVKDAINEDLAFLERIKKEYYDMYIKPIDERKTYRAGPEILDRNGNKRKYPHFKTDMFDKSNLVYEKYEEQMGFSKDESGKPIPIPKQTDEQIFNLFEKRIEGLKHCQTYKPEQMT